MRSGRPVNDLIHPDREAITPDDTDSDDRPDPESEHGERQQLPSALPPELSDRVCDLSHTVPLELPMRLAQPLKRVQTISIYNSDFRQRFTIRRSGT